MENGLGVGGMWVLMCIMYKKKRTRFGQKVRISEKNLLWLKENKDTKTLAGFLDKIINERKWNNIKNKKN